MMRALAYLFIYILLHFSFFRISRTTMRNTLREFSIIFISISPGTILNSAMKLYGNTPYDRKCRKKHHSVSTLFIRLSNRRRWHERDRLTRTASTRRESFEAMRFLYFHQILNYFPNRIRISSTATHCTEKGRIQPSCLLF